MKKQISILTFAMIISAAAYSQSDTGVFFAYDAMVISPVKKAEKDRKVPESKNLIIGESRDAKYQGGMEGLVEYLSENFYYPEEARENGYEGIVKVKFEILPDGALANIEVVESVNEILDKAALSIIENMPDWEPALHNGRPVKTRRIMPVKFSLE